MARARRHQRLLSVAAFGLLALVAELVGRSLIQRVDVGRHVRTPAYAGADYYPILLAAVKVGISLLLARLLWRLLRAHRTERAARRALAAVGARPRLQITLSPRLWLAFFALTSVIFLVQAHAEGIASGEHQQLVWPWLHSSALPVFAVLAVLMALVWAAVQRWLAEYERYAAESAEHARRLGSLDEEPRLFLPSPLWGPPRRLFGLTFESRPPPLTA